MYVTKYRLALALSLLSLVSATGAHAFDDDDGGRVYTRHDVACRNTGRDAGIGALAGAALGAGIGFLLGGNGTSAAIGGLSGGVAGGAIGVGLSCEERETYMDSVDQRLSRRDYWVDDDNDDDRVRVSVINSGYDMNRRVCRTYHTQFYSDRGWVTKEETACFVNGVWEHGYPSNVIETVRYQRRYPRSRVTLIERDRYRYGGNYGGRTYVNYNRYPRRERSYPYYGSSGVSVGIGVQFGSGISQ